MSSPRCPKLSYNGIILVFMVKLKWPHNSGINSSPGAGQNLETFNCGLSVFKLIILILNLDQGQEVGH